MTPRSFFRGVARRLRKLLNGKTPAAPPPLQTTSQAISQLPKVSAPKKSPRLRAQKTQQIRIAVIGNCQRIQLASCLSEMAANVILNPVPRTATSLPAQLAANDFVLLQPFRSDAISSLPLADRRRIVAFPRFYFPAFHPDLINCTSNASPLGKGSLNSGIALYAWLKKMSLEDASALYCGEVFEELGFLDKWERSKKLLLKEGRDCEMPLAGMFETWRKTGCFMHHPSHPKITVMADVSRAIGKKLNLEMKKLPSHTLEDLLARGAQWPVYPDIAARLGFTGSFEFVGRTDDGQRKTLTLPKFVEASFAIFEKSQPKEDEFSALEWQTYLRISGSHSGRSRWNSKPESSKNPYAGLPERQFWSRAVTATPPELVDPVKPPPFPFDKRTRIATAGSCFAQNIARALTARGFNYYVAEAAPPEMAPDDAAARNFGVFSARSGNIYTTRQLLQLFERAFGDFDPHVDIWQRPDGRYVDPFRPRMEPDGFETVSAMLAARDIHFAAVRHMFKTLEVFVFTLGLTEAWRTKRDGAVLPLAPGVVASSLNSSRYEFVNFNVDDVARDLKKFLKRLRRINPAARIILTVSPVPLVATYEDRHVLVSTIYSKSVLRVAAEIVAKSMENIWYFPSYEIITGNFNRGAYFEKDLRSVTPEGVDHVMRLFFEHGARKEELPEMPHAQDENIERIAKEPEAPASNPPAGDAGLDDAARDAEALRGFDIVCDEEELEKSAA